MGKQVKKKPIENGILCLDDEIIQSMEPGKIFEQEGVRQNEVM
jgi:hypothetical protein